MRRIDRMKRVLAYGASQTWGSCPHTQGRHPARACWPVALAEGLGGAEVVNEGLRGRTTAFDRFTAPVDMNGARALPMLLHSHAPLDLVIIMLGTNDLYEGYAPYQVRDGLARLVEIIRHHPWHLPAPCDPAVLLVSPPPMTLCDDADVTPEKVALSETLGSVIEALANSLDCGFFDAGGVGRASVGDGYHLDAATSRALGEALRKPAARLLDRAAPGQ